ncbi:bcl2-associated agonist of cell death [Mixophyes fleayi]|uniref:bcl2-associated agonist of cell death n=1 Tax=Mixophyes fleayi TaxID=3061075 RepID=UPI003F4E041B
MADSPHSIFSIGEFPQDQQGATLPETNPPSTRGATEHQSSPNLRLSKIKSRAAARGIEPRPRTESASEALETDNVGELQFRSRSRSAPSSLMVAARYGRELRRMSDEFDQIFTGLPRPKSAGAAAKMTESKSFGAMLMSLLRRKSKDRSEDETH